MPAFAYLWHDVWGHQTAYTYGVSKSATAETPRDRYIRQARRVGRSIALTSGYASPDDAEQDATVILLEYLARYPNASWLKARQRVIGYLWRLASPVAREERRRQRV